MTKLWPPSPTEVKELKKIIKDDLKMPKGWRTKKIHRGNFELIVYINLKKQLVCKAPAILMGREVEGITLPTIQLGNGWVLQPLCTFEDRSAALCSVVRRIVKLSDKFRGKTYKFGDVHLWNVGRWKKRPYLFDW